MKTKLALATLLVTTIAAASLADAQTIGLRIGPSFNNFNLKNAPSDFVVDQYVGYGVGLSFIWGNSPVKLQADGYYLTKGARFPQSATDSLEVRQKINYIELTPAIRLEVKNGPFLYGGPYGALEGQCLSSIKSGQYTIESNCNVSNVYLPFRHNIDYGLVGGAGWAYSIGKTGRRIVTLEARYVYGMRNINSDESDPVEVRNRSLEIMLGYATKPR